MSIPSDRKELIRLVLFTDHPKTSVREYVGNKILNAEIAILTGIGTAFFYKRFGQPSDSGVSFIDSSLDSIPFTARNPAFAVLVIFLLLALMFPYLKKIAEIAWDGAVFAFVSVMTAVLYLLHNIDSSLSAEAGEVIPIFWVVASAGTLVYAFFTSFAFHSALEMETVWTRCLLGTASVIYLLFFFK